MTDLADVPWPPQPIVTRRLVVRETQAADRGRYLDLLCSAEARRYLGGPLHRDDLERSAPAVPGNYPGVFAIADGGGFIGSVRLNRRDLDQPGHIRPEGGELEVSYLLLPQFWGRGYATEAVEAVLGWAETNLGDSEVILCTQTANARSPSPSLCGRPARRSPCGRPDVSMRRTSSVVGRLATGCVPQAGRLLHASRTRVALRRRCVLQLTDGYCASRTPVRHCARPDQRVGQGE